MNGASRTSPLDRLMFAFASSKIKWRLTLEFILTIGLIGDVLVIFSALVFSFWLRFDSGIIPFPSSILAAAAPTFFNYLHLLVIGALFLLTTFAYLGLYNHRCFLRYFRTAKIIVKGIFFWLFLYLSTSLILRFDPPISRMFMLVSFICAMVSILLWRYLFFQVMHLKFFAINFRQRVLFIGWGKEAMFLERGMQSDPHYPFETVGCLSSPQGKIRRQLPPTVPYLGYYENLENILKQRRADMVILADPYIPMSVMVEMANRCEREFVQFKVIPSYFQVMASGLRLEPIYGIPVLGVSELPLDRFLNRLLKRVLDIVGALFGLILSIPLILIIGILVYRESPGPILYRQERIGKNGRAFQILKIRSMRMHAEANGPQWTQEKDPRRLRIGELMRKWNIDEIPQFLNVLVGDMSLVGPRPERPEFISDFKYKIPHYHARHTCLPGMSGWAQINGWRGNTSLNERIRFDIWYIENWSIILDFKIMLLTFIKRKNAY